MPSRLSRVALHRKVMAGTALLVAAGVAVTTVPADAGDPAPVASANAAARDLVTWPSGVYSGITFGETQEFASYRGRTVAAVTQFQPSGSAAQMADVNYLVQTHKGKVGGILLSTAFWPQNSGGSLALAAKGTYNGIYRQLAQNLVANGMSGITLRPGWEFNGNWMPWQVQSVANARNFQYAWIHMVNSMRSVPGARFKFDWAPVASNNLQDPALSWPGSKYVDFVGMSVYNYTPNALSTPPAQRFQQLRTWKYGLNWQVKFAASKKKRVTYPEWAETNRPFSPSISSGDDPFFIMAMWYWFRMVHPAYEMYFDVDSGADFTFYGIATNSGLNPQSTAMYRKLWAKP